MVEGIDEFRAESRRARSARTAFSTIEMSQLFRPSLRMPEKRVDSVCTF